MSHVTTNSMPSSNFNESNEENSRYLFQFSEWGKRGKIIAHSTFVDLMSSKEGKNLRIFSILRVRNGPKKASSLVATIYV